MNKKAVKPQGLIVALDVPKSETAKNLVTQLGAVVDYYKVPPSLVMEDAGLLSWLKEQGKNVFFDGKWYDIPSQVQRSVESAGHAGVMACTVHVSAGRDVLKAALMAYPRPLIWGVTVLTSFGENDLTELGIQGGPAEQVLRLAELAQREAIDGLVCAPTEITMLRENGITLPLITPGIQWSTGVGSDQSRVATPQQAWGDGAHWIVVGRAILQAKDPIQATRDILAARPSHANP